MGEKAVNFPAYFLFSLLYTSSLLPVTKFQNESLTRIMSNEFKVVTSKKKRKSERKNKFDYNSVAVSRSPLIVDEKKCVKNLLEARDTVRCTEFYSSVKGDISCALSTSMQHSVSMSTVDDKGDGGRVVDFVCYGLGNFSDCLISRYQLALLLALREDLQISTSHCHVYDPKFSLGEINVLQQLGLSVIKENEEGKRPCVTTTLFYMPHCGKALYNNVLWSNWNAESLCRLVFIGNSFSNIVQNTPSRLLEKTGAYIQKITPYCGEVPFPTNFQYSDVFNDTAIHGFPGDTLLGIPAALWLDNLEPQYQEDDLEIIPNKHST